MYNFLMASPKIYLICGKFGGGGTITELLLMTAGSNGGGLTTFDGATGAF